MTEAQKAARRLEINSQLAIARHNRDTNISERTRLIDSIQRMRRASGQLGSSINDLSSNVQRNLSIVVQRIAKREFNGTRRQELQAYMTECATSVGEQVNRHNNNMETLTARITTVERKRDQLTHAINALNTSISQLEAELSSL